uniref:Uncharacterized protein n=1 Tax=Daphnia magna TaxID=35525 RepID=A0A0N8DS93_9CRUS
MRKNFSKAHTLSPLSEKCTAHLTGRDVAGEKSFRIIIINQFLCFRETFLSFSLFRNWKKKKCN